ncbi:MAG: DUF2306 domain-containing protein [Proteobacteria bacterium]|nr:DUF2306 domain-containing protein [Pseudomonadota bacterium]MDA1059352.1 DUF2306 domain-containing protein [Pseudomonadota bacterium]
MTNTAPLRRTGPTAWPRRQWASWLVATLLAGAIALFSLHYLRPGMPSGFPEQLATFREHALWFRLHVVGGAIALALGPFQFLPGLRTKRPGLHRWNGRLYLSGIVAGTVGGLYMAQLSFGGNVTHLGFGLLAVSWFATTAMALRAILAGDVVHHRRWMIRSYALTFAAVTLRLWLPGLAAALPFETAYQLVSWLAWTPNLIAAEIYLRYRPTPPN